MTYFDKASHTICNHFAEIRWCDFPENAIDDSRLYQYHYAEDGLYVIKNKISNTFAFERARSSIEALRLLVNGWSAN